MRCCNARQVSGLGAGLKNIWVDQWGHYALMCPGLQESYPAKWKFHANVPTGKSIHSTTPQCMVGEEWIHPEYKQFINSNTSEFCEARFP